MARTSAVWGIDIGQCALKALRCRVAADGEAIEVDKYDYIEYPKLLSQADANPEELVEEALNQFLSRNDLQGDSVAISVPGQAGLSRFFKPPPVDAKTLPDIVKYEVKQQIPFPIEDVIWDWQQLGGSIIEGRTMDAEIGLFAMKREAVFRALQPFDKADVEVDYIQLSPLSIFNVVGYDILDELPSAEEMDPDNPPESMVVVSMGTDTTDLIITNGIKLWLRNIPIGGNHFTKQLSREMKLTHAKAEHLKRNARQAEDPQSVFRAMRPVFSDLVNEVQRSLTFFQSMDKSARISKIVLLGNAAKLPGLRQYLNKQLEIDIAKVTSFNKLVGDEVTGQKSFEENQLSFAPAYGLCLQGLGKGQINTNLLPNEIVTERIVRAKKPWVLASVSFIMFGLLLGYFFKEKAHAVVQPEHEVNAISWENAQQKATQVSNESKQKKQTDEELTDRLNKLNRLSKELTSSFESRSRWIEVLSAIYQALPVDERLQDKDVIDPSEVRFNDREEIYLESIETKFFKDINEWYKNNQPLYDAQFDEESDANKAGEVEAVKQQAKQAAQATEAEVKGPGWVIEITGYHFHNSSDKVIRSEYGTGRTYVINRFLSNFFKDVTFPGEENANQGGGSYKFEDFGIYLPTIVSNYDFKDVELTYGELDDRGNPTETEAVRQYDFIIQMAWIPRSPRERFEAKQKRETEEAKKREAEEAAAAAAAAQENPGT